MTNSQSQLKSVTANTSFSAVRVYDEGMARNALIDQDGQLVGLVDRDTPFFIDGSFSQACVKAKGALNKGANYIGYPCSPFGSMYYVQDKVLEPVTEFSDIPKVREAEELANDAIALLHQIRARKGSTIPSLPNEKVIN